MACMVLFVCAAETSLALAQQNTKSPEGRRPGLTAPRGTTYHFIWLREPDEEALRDCIEQMGLVVVATRSVLAGPDGTGEPVVRDLTIQFNGIAPDAGDPFEFPGQDGANSCQTGGNAYGDVVMLCLLVARDHFSADTLEISTSDKASLRSGELLYQSRMGRTPPDLSDRGEPWWINLLVPAVIVAVLVWVFRRV